MSEKRNWVRAPMRSASQYLDVALHLTINLAQHRPLGRTTRSSRRVGGEIGAATAKRIYALKVTFDGCTEVLLVGPKRSTSLASLALMETAVVDEVKSKRRALWLAAQRPLLAVSLGACVSVPFAASTADARVGDSWVVGSGGLVPGSCIALAVSLIAAGVLHRVRRAIDDRLVIFAVIVGSMAAFYVVSNSGAQISGASKANIATVRQVVEAVPLNECKNPAWARVTVVYAAEDRVELRCDSGWGLSARNGFPFTMRCIDRRWQGDPIPGEGFGDDYKWDGPACGV